MGTTFLYPSGANPTADDDYPQSAAALPRGHYFDDNYPYHFDIISSHVGPAPKQRPIGRYPVSCVTDKAHF